MVALDLTVHSMRVILHSTLRLWKLYHAWIWRAFCCLSQGWVVGPHSSS